MAKQGNDIYLVVGYSTLQDAIITEAISTSNHASGSVTAPLSCALSASTGIFIPVDDIDVAASLNQDQTSSAMKQFTIPGESVCALQYRKIRVKWYSSRNLDKASLDKANMWRTYASVRGQAAEGEDDVVQVVAFATGVP